MNEKERKLIISSLEEYRMPPRLWVQIDDGEIRPLWGCRYAPYRTQARKRARTTDLKEIWERVSERWEDTGIEGDRGNDMGFG